MPTRITAKDRRTFLDRALKAADWYVNSQLGDYRPRWNADRGRFLYYYFIPEGRHVPGINWTEGRGLFVTCEAYKLTGDERYRRAAELAVRYVAALQVMDPRYKRILGAIKEHTPQDEIGGALDGAQAASGLLMYAAVTGDKDALRGGRAFCDFIERHFSARRGMPVAAITYPTEQVTFAVEGGFDAERKFDCIRQATAIPLCHLHRRTREKKYLRVVRYAADYIVSCQRADGGIQDTPDISVASPPPANHHDGRGQGDDRYLLRNDDAIMVVVLAAYLATDERKYLDAAVAYADWTIANEPHDRPIVGFSIQANNVLDIGKVARKDYTPWVLDHLQKHLLDLQVIGSGDPRAEGGFRGEDEENEGGIFGGSSFDYVTNRVTCYSAGTLFRLSGKGTGAGFSPFGLDY